MSSYLCMWHVQEPLRLSSPWCIWCWKHCQQVVYLMQRNALYRMLVCNEMSVDGWNLSMAAGILIFVIQLSRTNSQFCFRVIRLAALEFIQMCSCACHVHGARAVTVGAHVTHTSSKAMCSCCVHVIWISTSDACHDMHVNCTLHQ